MYEKGISFLIAEDGDCNLKPFFSFKDLFVSDLSIKQDKSMQWKKEKNATIYFRYPIYLYKGNCSLNKLFIK